MLDNEGLSVRSHELVPRAHPPEPRAAHSAPRRPWRSAQCGARGACVAPVLAVITGPYEGSPFHSLRSSLVDHGALSEARRGSGSSRRHSCKLQPTRSNTIAPSRAPSQDPVNPAHWLHNRAPTRTSSTLRLGSTNCMSLSEFISSRCSHLGTIRSYSLGGAAPCAIQCQFKIEFWRGFARSFAKLAAPNGRQ